MVQDLYVLMITAAVVSILFKLLKQPVVLGYIVAGVLVGPHLFGQTLVNADNVKAWGDIGVLFVLFCIGLEFRLKNLISSGKVAAVGALTIILGMMLFGYAVGVDAEFDMVNSLFLAGMLCMSSTTIVMKAIDEAGLSKERFVKGATSILIVEDVVAVVLMVLLSSIAIRHQFEGAELAGKVVDLAITLAAWFICGILIIPTLIRLIKKHLNDETLIILALGLCLGMVLTAEEAGFSSALGAFVMGSILAETIESHRIEKLMTPLKNVFAAIFFISVGMLIDPASLAEYWVSVVYVCPDWRVLVHHRFAGYQPRRSQSYHLSHHRGSQCGDYLPHTLYYEGCRALLYLPLQSRIKELACQDRPARAASGRSRGDQVIRWQGFIGRQGTPCRQTYLYHETSCQSVHQEHECSRRVMQNITYQGRTE